MIKHFSTLLAVLSLSVPLFSQSITIYKSEAKVGETVAKIVDQIKTNQELIFFEVVDHDVIAAKRGITLEPTKSILFEDPILTSTLLECQKSAALDLPLEILVWEEYGDVYVGFMDPKFMKRRFMIQECDDTIEQLSRLMIRVSMNALRELK